MHVHRTSNAGILGLKSVDHMYMPTLVPEVFLDFSPHKRAVSEPRNDEHESRSGFFFLAASRLVFAVSWLSHAEKNQEKPLGPG